MSRADKNAIVARRIFLLMRLREKVAMLTLALCIVSSALNGSAQSVARFDKNEEATLRTFLRSYLSDPLEDQKSTRYVAVAVSLTDHERDVIVYFTDQYSCGSGGCTTLILAPDNASYRVVSSVTIVQLPIRVLNSTTKGWHDIGVWVQGGGIQPGYEAILSFDGKSYPENPSVEPARKADHAAGRVIISRNDEGVPLYQ